MKIINRIFIKSGILLLFVGVLTSCAVSGKAKVGTNVEQVEKLQNNTEYSAVESEWNELYQ